MEIRRQLPAFVCGVMSAVVALALFVDVNAQPTAPEEVDVCADAEGTLRLTEPLMPCKPGERRLRLKQPDIEVDKENESSAKERVAELEKRLVELEKRRDAGKLVGSKAVAPFEVVDNADQRIFVVDQGRAVLYSGGTVVARLVANESGGYLETRSATANLGATIGVSGNRASVLVAENGRDRIDLGRNDKGNYGLRVYEPGGHMIAGIGQAFTGSGVAMVADTSGAERARIYVQPNGGGIIEIANAQGTGVATLSAGAQGSGLLQLSNNSGKVMVEAGVTQEGVGLVRAGPSGFPPGAGLIGLPGSFIIGKAAK
jgi:hypothetical protein